MEAISMKKIAYLAWLLLMMPSVKQPTLLFENGSHYTSQNENLLLEADEPFEGVLYHDDEVFSKFVVEDFKDGKIVFEIDEAGIYTLFNKENEFIAKAIFQDNQFHIAFDTPVKQKQEKRYLFQRSPTTWVMSPIEDEVLESKNMGDCYFYEIKETKFSFLDEMFELLVDDTKPVVTIEDLYEVEEDTYITNQSHVTLVYSDTFPEAFPFSEIMEDRFEIEITLNEGINDLSCWLMDRAGNQERQKLWVIKDSKKPEAKIEQPIIYTNQSSKIEIDEAYLDYSQSHYFWNGEKKQLEEPFLTYHESGNLSLFLLDLAGNQLNQEVQIVLDQQAPTYTKTIENNQLSLTFSESLKSKSIVLMHESGSVDLNGLDSYVFLEEGMYHLAGECIDLAGNRARIEESFLIDLSFPQLEVLIEDGTILHQSTTFQVKIEDAYLKEWKIQVLRNQSLIREYTGVKSHSQEVTLDDTTYKDGSGKYDIIVWGSDGLHENQITKSIVLDTKCAPIRMRINGYDADNVTSLLLSNTTVFDLLCDEGMVMWQLYTNEGVIENGQGRSLTLYENKDYTKLELTVEDAYGFKQSKTIYFEVDETNTELLNEKAEVVTGVEKKTDDFELPGATSKNEKNTVDLHMFVLGGILLAIIALRQFTIRNLRLRKDELHLSHQQELPLQDSENTVMLSTSSDKTSHL